MSTAGGTAGPAGRRPVLGPRPKLTSRAAVLAIVLCAIALSLAYPVREYIAERRQIDELAVSNARMAAEVRYLQTEQHSLSSPAVIEQEARDDLHMCFPSETCYEVIFPVKSHARTASKQVVTPWYGRLWESVAAADKTTSR